MDDDGRGYFSNKANAALALWTTPTVVGQKSCVTAQQMFHCSDSFLEFFVWCIFFLFPSCNEEVLTGRRRKQEFKAERSFEFWISSHDSCGGRLLGKQT